MQQLTRAELARYDGRNGAPAYVAYRGRVYDVSQSFLWKQGRHQASHSAGTDLTGDLDAAPHGADLLARFPVIGTLIDSP